MEIHDILRAHGVTRWHTVPLTRNQTLAEHLFNVTMIARDICRRIDVDDAEVIKLTLEHDLDEVVFGDIPSPAKSVYGMVEPYRGKNKPTCSQLAVDIVKLADTVEAYWYIKQYGAGRLGTSARVYMKSAVDAMFNDPRYPPWLLSAVSDILYLLDNGQFEGHGYVRNKVLE